MGQAEAGEVGEKMTDIKKPKEIVDKMMKNYQSLKLKKNDLLYTNEFTKIVDLLSPPTIEQLIEMNRNAKRMIMQVGSRKRRYFVDAEDKEVKAIPFSFPQVISVPRVNDTFSLESRFVERPYRFSPVNPSWQGFLSRDEVRLVLGRDDVGNGSKSEINARLQAAAEGPVLPGLANAYVLGANCGGIHREDSFDVIPVQYYQINERRHKRLGIESDKDKLSGIIASIKCDPFRNFKVKIECYPLIQSKGMPVRFHKIT